MVGMLHTELRLTYQRVSSFFIPRKEEVGRSHCCFLTLGSFIEETFPLQLFAKGKYGNLHSQLVVMVTHSCIKTSLAMLAERENKGRILYGSKHILMKS